MKAFSYLRVSGKGQIEGDGLTRQRVAIAEYAKAHKIKIVGEYVDAGVSGAKGLADRPELGRLLVELKENHKDVELVIVEKLDRLARDVIVQEKIIQELSDIDRKLCSTAEGMDLDSDPSRKLIRQIFGAISEYDKDMTVLKLAAARKRIRDREGRCEGRKTFGYHEDQKKVLQRVRQLRRRKRFQERMPFHEVAKQLNEEGFVNSNGKPWTKDAIRTVSQRGLPRRLRISHVE